MSEYSNNPEPRITTKDFRELYEELVATYGQVETITMLAGPNNGTIEATFIAYQPPEEPRQGMLEIARAHYRDNEAVIKAYEAAQHTNDFGNFLINYAPQAPHLIRLFADGGYDIRPLKEGVPTPGNAALYLELDALLDAD